MDSVVILMNVSECKYCGGVLLPGQRVATANSCIPENYALIKINMLQILKHFDIHYVERKGHIAMLYVSSSRHQN